MEKIYKISSLRLLSVLVAFLFVGCGTMRPPVIKNFDDSINNYRYFYISPTVDYSYESGLYGEKYGSYESKSISPRTIISGILMKNGFVPVNEIDPSKAKETMIVNFGESGRRYINLGYSIEVTIQFISAYSQRPICTCTAEGQGATEVDDIQEAINRALNSLFKAKK